MSQVPQKYVVFRNYYTKYCISLWHFEIGYGLVIFLSHQPHTSVGSSPDPSPSVPHVSFCPAFVPHHFLPPSLGLLYRLGSSPGKYPEVSIPCHRVTLHIHSYCRSIYNGISKGMEPTQKSSKRWTDNEEVIPTHNSFYSAAKRSDICRQTDEWRVLMYSLLLVSSRLCNKIRYSEQLKQRKSICSQFVTPVSQR